MGLGRPERSASNIAATAHLNYVVALPEFDNLVAAFSFSKTNSRAGKDLNGLLKQNARVPIFARLFTATTYEDRRAGGEFNTVKIAPAGFVNDPETFAFYKAIASQFATGFVVDQSDDRGEEESDNGAV